MKAGRIPILNQLFASPLFVPRTVPKVAYVDTGYWLMLLMFSSASIYVQLPASTYR